MQIPIVLIFVFSLFFLSPDKTQNQQFSEKGFASYYGTRFHGKLTASGEKFNMHALTAAHKKLPFNTLVRIKNLKNGKSVVVRINDRGPYIKGRIIDLSYGAAKKIGLIKVGTTCVELEVVENFAEPIIDSTVNSIP